MKKVLIFLLILISVQSIAQEDAWVFLADKPNAATFLEYPLSMLTQRSLDRRERQNISLDIKDVPIESSYYVQIKNTNGITVLAKSKWLNALHVQGTKDNIAALQTTFSFVASIQFADRTLHARSSQIAVKTTINHQQKFKETLATINYGVAENQLTMLHGEYLHQQGFTGTGMQIAIIDAGFPNVNNNPAFQRLRDNNQILGGYDFVHRTANFYTGNSHGAHVLSTIGGFLEDEFVGTAPDAKFYLFISEDVSQEAPIEESLWVEAAERADSLGVDVLNTSLGYTTFDNPRYNHTYADMDGKTTFISRGATIASTRGMLVVNAAGNSGNSAWYYIGAPADAEGVLAVGAVDASTNLASFSSRGPTSDQRIKPDIMAQGRAAFVLNYQTGTPNTASGTSFSSPIMAGTIACFWQAFPNATVSEIKQAIKESAHNFLNPDNNYGYGIPNFEEAYSFLSQEELLSVGLYVKVYPNPIKNTLHLKYIRGAITKYAITIYSILGHKVYQQKQVLSKNIDVSFLHKGVYFLKIDKGNIYKIIRLIKE